MDQMTYTNTECDMPFLSTPLQWLVKKGTSVEQVSFSGIGLLRSVKDKELVNHMSYVAELALVMVIKPQTNI